MFPILESSYNNISLINYDNNGLGSLTDAISCTVVEELNGEFELTLEYPMNGIQANLIDNRRIIRAIPSPYREQEAFRIYSIESNIEGIWTIHAHHISYDLTGVPVNPFGANGTLNALQGLVDNSAVNLGFTVDVWEMPSKAHFELTHPQSFRESLAGVEGSILDVFGGEYTFNRNKITLGKFRGQKRYARVGYGKNLIDFNREVNSETLVTGVYPYWVDSEGENLVELDEKIIPILDKATSWNHILLKEGGGDYLCDDAGFRLSTYATFGFDNIVTLDCSEYFDEMPTKGQLKKRAKEYIYDNDLGEIRYSVEAKFVNLDRSDEYRDKTLMENMDLGDTVFLQYQLYEDVIQEEEARITRIETDVLKEIYNDVTVGARRTNIADTISYLVRRATMRKPMPMKTYRRKGY